MCDNELQIQNCVSIKSKEATADMYLVLLILRLGRTLAIQMFFWHLSALLARIAA